MALMFLQDFIFFSSFFILPPNELAFCGPKNIQKNDSKWL